MADNMRAAVLYGKKDLRIEKRKIPKISDDELLIKIERVGICGSDVHYYKEGRIGDFIVEKPMVLGHEAAGIIADIGANVKGFKKEDRVAIEPGIPCYKCQYCKSGRYNLCQNIAFFATPPFDGAFCDYVRFSPNFTFKLPEKMSFEEGAMLEPFAVGLFSVYKSELKPGNTILIIGAGTIGLMILQAAKASGAGEIICVDIDDEKLEYASKFGANKVINTKNNDIYSELEYLVSKNSIDIIFDAVGIGETAKQSIDLIKPGGTLVWVGLSNDIEGLPIGKIVFKEIDIKGMFRYANMYGPAIKLVQNKAVSLKELITKRIKFEDLLKTMDDIADGKLKGIKTIVEL